MTTIAARYAEISRSPDWQDLVKKYSYEGLSNEEIASLKSKGLSFYRGKVRDLIIEANHIRLLHSDRLTAFDKYITAVPYKGVILTALSKYWLEQAAQVVPTHLISSPNARELLVRKTTPFKIEVVVRAYLAGSMSRAYMAGQRSYCGETLPEGLSPFAKLDRLMLTPTTKAPVFEHDENISAQDAIVKGLCTAKEWEQIRGMAIKLFNMGTNLLAQKGWILVDTKYEFGKTTDGEIILIDEIHTPDSSRFWRSSTYQQRMDRGEQPEMLDKEVLRRWLLAQGYKGEGPVPVVPRDVLLELAGVYLEVAEAICGGPLRTH